MSFIDDKELQEYRDIMTPPEAQGFEDGFNWKAVAGAVLLGFFVNPATDYLSLVIGNDANIGGAMKWVLVILFAEIAKRSFTDLKSQELYVLHFMSGAVLADPFAVSLHGITRNPPPEGGKVLVYGAGALGTTAIAILGALYPGVEVMAVARFEAQAQLARSLGAEVVGHDPRLVMETAAKWSGAVLRGTTGNGTPMAFPGGIDVVYDTIGKPESLEVGVGLLKARGRLVKLGVHGSAAWEAFPLYFKEIFLVGSNAFGIEEVGGVRKHGILHYFDMVGSRQIDLAGMLTHTFRLEQWRDAFTTLATQARTGAIKVAFDFRA